MYIYVSKPPTLINFVGYELRRSGESISSQYVFFDNLNVEISESPILESSDYYPFGLTFNSYTKPGTVDQRYKYNGKEEQKETGWLDFDTRMYDAAIGRFIGIDMLSEKYSFQSPYVYGLNDPIRYIDAYGMGGLDDLKDGVSGLWNLLSSSNSYKEIGAGFNELGSRIKREITKLNSGMYGSEPDTRGSGDKSNFGGETLTKTEGNMGSQGIEGNPSTENDITMLTNAKEIGGAKTGTPGSTAEIVKDVAEAVNQVVEVAQSPSNSRPSPETKLGGSFNHADSSGTTRYIDENGNMATRHLTKEEIFPHLYNQE